MNNTVDSQITKALREESDLHSKRERSGKWNPSAFGQCFKRQYLKRLNFPETNPPDDRALKIFKVGHMFEDFIFSFLKTERQVRVETDDVLGYADGVGEDEVQEVKTQHSMKFWHINKAKKESPDFSIVNECREHVLQGMFYVRELKKKFLRMIYISKDDLCTDEYVIPYTPEIEEMLRSEMSILSHFWEKKEEPPSEPRLYRDKKTGQFKECQYCQFRDYCKGVDNGE